MSDTISSDDPGRRWPGARRPGRSALPAGALATAVATAASLVLIGGVVTASVRVGQTSSAAADLVPASAFAFAEVNVAPAGGQSNALKQFLDHFPSSPTHAKGAVRDTLLRALLRDSSDPHVDYDKDVRPWLGDHAAVAGWLDSAGTPTAEYLLQSKNDKQAKASLHRAAPTMGIDLVKGYLVLAATQAEADAAVTAAGKRSLDDIGYRSDIGKLSGSQIATGWMDAPNAMKAFQHITHGRLSPFGLAAPFGTDLKSAQGRIVAGLHATKDYVELAARSLHGGKAPALAPTTLLTHLPNATIAAADLADPAGTVTNVMSALQFVFGGVSSGADSESKPGDLTGLVEQATGLVLPADADTAFGPSLVVSFAGLGLGGVPKVALRTTPHDLTAARAVAERARGVIGGKTGFRLGVGTAGHDLVVATSDDYAHDVATGGSLGAQPRFRRAMGALPSQVGFALYADLADILPLFAPRDSVLAHFDAFGLWVGRTGNDTVVTARLVAR
jgi:hypothetical protein